MSAHLYATRLVSSLLLATLLLGAAAAHAESTRAWSFKPDTGFIGDPMAFNAGQSQFAYIHTDSAQFLNIIVRSTTDFKQVAEIKLVNAAAIPKQLVFTQDGKRLIFVWMDGYKGTLGATLLDIAEKKVLKKIGPAEHVAIVPHKGKQVLTLTKTKTDKKGGNTFNVSAHRTTDFRKVARGKTYVQADLRLRKPKVRLLYWEPGHTSLVGMQKGKYDRKRDIRLPERGTRYNLLLRKVTWSEEPKEVVAWTKATTMRPNHKGQLRFLQVADDLKTIHYVDQNNALGSVQTPVKWGLYEPKSLVQSESWDGKQLHFSVTIDPVNPDAVKRKKADKERCDLYRLDAGSSVVPLGQVLTRGRKFTWVAGTSLFAYLYKLRGFGRGGKEVVIFKAGTK